ncbi:MAG: hypothetical protein OEY06_09015 [Gammaproteobacteria bacterium]|nr:hypothetical protein [Gammaproteobacteria bacterium]
MSAKIWITLISSVTFGLGVGVASYAVTSGPGGHAKLKIGEFEFEIQINEANIPALLESRASDESIKEEAKRIYGLYEVDSDLITKISSLNYKDTFSEGLRKIRNKFIGPFNAPDIQVKIKFSDSLKINHAQVCPDSDFYKNRINVALSDFSNMYPVDDAGVAIIHGCPTPSGMPELVIISTELGKKLLNKSSLPTSIDAVAKVLPSYVIVN